MKNHGNPPKTMKNHETTLKTMENNQKPWKLTSFDPKTLRYQQVGPTDLLWSKNITWQTRGPNWPFRCLDCHEESSGVVEIWVHLEIFHFLQWWHVECCLPVSSKLVASSLIQPNPIQAYSATFCFPAHQTRPSNHLLRAATTVQTHQVKLQGAVVTLRTYKWLSLWQNVRYYDK